MKIRKQLILGYIIADIMVSGHKLLKQAGDAIFRTEKSANQNELVIWNSQSFARSEVITIETPESQKGQPKKKQKVESPATQYDAMGRGLCE